MSVNELTDVQRRKLKIGYNAVFYLTAQWPDLWRAWDEDEAARVIASLIPDDAAQAEAELDARLGKLDDKYVPTERRFSVFAELREALGYSEGGPIGAVLTDATGVVREFTKDHCLACLLPKTRCVCDAEPKTEGANTISESVQWLSDFSDRAELPIGELLDIAIRFAKTGKPARRLDNTAFIAYSEVDRDEFWGHVETVTGIDKKCAARFWYARPFA